MLQLHTKTVVGFYMKRSLILPDLNKNCKSRQILVKCLISKIHENQVRFSRGATCELLDGENHAFVQIVIAKALNSPSILPREHRV